ncbi:hypothetical protein VNO77_19200 [Canavalia gladiata]|uniref:Uncharacterized protein n=1 Tax=Canavalia gladiata TaxID=3824 RepID=A0AAN9QPD9_CANGL
MHVRRLSYVKLQGQLSSFTGIFALANLVGLVVLGLHKYLHEKAPKLATSLVRHHLRHNRHHLESDKLYILAIWELLGQEVNGISSRHSTGLGPKESWREVKEKKEGKPIHARKKREDYV